MPQRDDIKRGQQHAGRLLNDPKFVDVFADLVEDEQAFNEAKQNPREFFKDRGVTIPGNPTDIRVEEGSVKVSICWGKLCASVEF